MKIAVTLFACILAVSMHAQEVSHAFSIGIGSSSVYDEYLSPLSYSGTEIRVQRETMRPTHLMGGNVHVQTLLNMHASHGKSQSNNGEMYDGRVNWNVSWLYRWTLNDKLTLMAGPMLDLNGGATYNRRNSNNPAQAKVYANADVSGMAYYRFHWLKHDFRLRYQLSLPVLGAMYSPEYGESYYEIFDLKQGGLHNVCLTTPFNQPSFRHSLYLDFTLYNTNMRIGYVGDIQQSKVNHLRNHSYGHAFMVGIIKNFEISKKPIQ